MSIKIEGEGSKENVFSDSDSGMPLWNGKPLLNLVYPVGSIYWSSNNTNPGTLFGGTWTQIKDKFILAAGDSYTNGATGGAATVTLTVSNMPSHKHGFTPSGKVGSHKHTGPSHTHSFTPSGKVGSHTHTGPSHTHSFTPSGTISINGDHTHLVYYDLDDSIGTANSFAVNQGISRYHELEGTSKAGSHRHDFSGTAGNTGAAGTGNTGSTEPSFTGTAGNTGAAGTGNTGSTEPSFTGTAGNTDSSGSGSSFSILPPYVVKYCWERTA